MKCFLSHNLILIKQEVELETTRAAHKQRYDRYKYLQENHELVLKQLETYEEEGLV